MFRNDTYVGNEHYWIIFRNGTHEVRRETLPCEPDNETVLTGSFESCLAWIRQAEEDYYTSLY